MDFGCVDQHFIKMAALGRRFQLGDLYNYCTDQILTESRLCWNSADLASSTSREIGFKIKSFCPDSDTSHKWQHMKLDEHLQASILAGLLDKLRGASQYVSEKSNPTQVSRTFICRTRNKNERLDLPTFLSHNIPTISTDEKLAGATHVVVGITYGAEAYCVLTQDVNEDNEDAREVTAEYLAKLSSKMQNAMEDKQDATDFKDQFDNEEKKLVSQIKCRVYADLQTQPVRECSLFEAYKHCMKLVEVMTSNNEKAIPVAAILCPLEIVMNAKGNFEKRLNYRDVDAELVDRCCNISTELERVISRSNSLRLTFTKPICPALRQFVEVVSKFRGLTTCSWKKGIIKARKNENEDDEVEKATNIAETHSIFKISRLNRWLRFKRAELEMAVKLDSLNGITYFADNSQLENKLADSFDKKFTLVLYIPQLDERTEDMLSGMKDHIESYINLVDGDADDDESDADDESDDDGDEKELPWHMLISKKKQVMGKIREMADHVEKNRHLENQVQFFISTQEIDEKLECRFSIYQADNLVKDKIVKLPTAPTGLRIQLDTKRPKMSSIHLTWDYEDLGYPCTFLVEYRPKDDLEEIWKQKKTSKPGETQTTINLGQDSGVFEFRVAAETCIGRSEFSEIVDMESALDINRSKDVKEDLNVSAKRGDIQPSQKRNGLLPPTKLFVDSVTQTTAELVWTPPTNSAACAAFSYSIRYRQNGQRFSVHIGVDSSQSNFRLEDLKPGTTYSIVVIAKTEDGQERASSIIIEFTTQQQEVSTPVVSAQCSDSTFIDEQMDSASNSTKKPNAAKSSRTGPLNEKSKKSTEGSAKPKTRKRGIGETVNQSKSKVLEELPVEPQRKVMKMEVDTDRRKTKASRPLLKGEAKIAMDKKWFSTIESTNVNALAIQELVLNGADVNAKDYLGCTALHRVCYKSSTLPAFVRLLVNNGVDVNSKNKHGRTALHHLCRFSENLDLDILRLLVEQKVDVNAKDSDGKTALHTLCESHICFIGRDLFGAMRLLVENGIDVNAKDNDGKTALHLFCQSSISFICDNPSDIVRLLVEYNVDVNAKDGVGKTALHLMCEHNIDRDLFDVVRILVESGADVKAKNNKGRTPQNCISSHRNEDVKEFLKILG